MNGQKTIQIDDPRESPARFIAWCRDREAAQTYLKTGRMNRRVRRLLARLRDQLEEDGCVR